MTAKVPRVGAVLELTLSSDLFPDVLQVTGCAAWVSDQRVGVDFADAATAGTLSPEEWVERVVEHGRVLGPELVGPGGPRLVPVIRRPSSTVPLAWPSEAPPRDAPGGGDHRVIPLHHG